MIRLVLIALLFATSAFAQQVPTTDDPVAEAPIRLGVVGVRPRLGITDFGIDSNVFNSQVNKQRDLTFTVRPGAMLFLRTGRGLLTLNGDLAVVYFHEFESERSLNTTVGAEYEFRFNRLRPFAGATYTNTRERAGFEIDARAGREEITLRAGVDLRIASKTVLRSEFRRADSSYDDDAQFGGQLLSASLSRDLQAIDLSWRQRLTALTTWVTRVSLEKERFDFLRLRDSDTVRVSSGFELGRFALIRGSAFAGYRRLKGADGALIPSFSGLTSDIDVSYTAPTQTRVSAEVTRDLSYSYDLLTPYYVQTGWTATVTQRVTGRWDVQASGGRDRLSYQGIFDSLDRRDFVGRWGGGVGYNLGDQVRMGFNIQSFYRSSEVPDREYGGLRAGVSVTYGY